MTSETSSVPAVENTQPAVLQRVVWGLLLVGVLMVGAYFRFTGLDWDGDYHLHPDERFMTMVASSIESTRSLPDYFNTAASSLNPNNRGYGFYVYGTLPLFLVRYVAEQVGKVGYSEIHLVGRALSGLFDLLTVLLVYRIAVRLYRNPRLGLLAAAFSALSVLPIQLSHYFTVDTFTNFFVFLGIYFAVQVFTEEPPQPENAQEGAGAELSLDRLGGAWNSVTPYALFGLALGMAMASKVNAAPLTALLPLAALLYWLRLPPELRPRRTAILLRNLVIAALVAFFTFRIFQPYAFSGPGFFGLKPNPNWVDNLRSLSQQSGGDVDFPPALQWARRPVTFAWTNMVKWGLGLPLGLLAWIGFLWMGWRMIKGEWRKHVLLWGWTGTYFVWQSLIFSRSMRYQLPIYPALAIMAAWAVFRLWQRRARRNWPRAAAFGVGGGVLAATFLWALAFSQIYARPVTRIAASRWIYQHVPAAINLHIDRGGQSYDNLPLPFRMSNPVTDRQPMQIAFEAQWDGTLVGVDFEHGVDSLGGASPQTLLATISSERDGAPLAQGSLVDVFLPEGDPRGKSYQLMLAQILDVRKGERYYLSIRPVEPGSALDLAGPLYLGYALRDRVIRQALPESVLALRTGQSYAYPFVPDRNGEVREAFIPHIVDLEGYSEPKQLRLSIRGALGDGRSEATAEVRSDFAAIDDARGRGYTFTFEPAAVLLPGQSYTVDLETTAGPGALAIYGSKQALESTWDDPLPYSMDGNSVFDYYTGLYRTDLNFEMYWDDNPDKLERFVNNLDQADYLFISSNRQWGTTTRVPERYPLTTAYYRSLIGCPAEKEIVWCYRVAQPGSFHGKLGFELVQVFQSDPNLGSLRFNTQFAEEAFTVYDHPKVLIFKKTAAYSSEEVRSLLGRVDLNSVQRLTPRKVPLQPARDRGDLMLPEDRLAQQRAGGTWSDLFSYSDLQNRFPALGAALWYLVVMLLGWAVFPFVRLALRGLPDRGYPVARLVGILLLALLVWLAGSFGVPFTQATITIAAVALLAVNVGLLFLQKDDLLQELRERRRYILVVEGLALAFFLVFLFIRLGNPDLWHPAKGGEKPMDFSYLNAVIKSTSFPPYDPWFAGGYLNYYYYGFVLMGVLIKWLGIVPSIAYNIFLPALFSLLALGAFSFGWNLLGREPGAERGGGGPPENGGLFGLARWPTLAGLASALALLVLGNLGTVRMIWRGFQQLAAPGAIEAGNFLQHWLWSIQGFARFLGGQALPYDLGRWYWDPSRVIPGEPITEFPFFTFLYADPHAHLIALPITVLVLVWALSIVRGKWRWGNGRGRRGWLCFGASLLLGGLAIGALRPTNTWDLYPYMVLGGLALLYTAGRYAQAPAWLAGLRLRPWLVRLATGVVAAGLLVVLSFLLYQPFARWFLQGYSAVDLWKGDHTPFEAYITHWGLFLFVIISWLFWETRDWMAKTPVSALNRLRPYKNLLIGLLVVLFLAVVGLTVMRVQIAWLALPLAAWAAVLILRPNQPDAKRVVLFMIGSGLTLTLAVELVVLRGDIGRMNTVFKFYLQAWTLLSLSAAAGSMWLFPAVLREWRAGWRNAWQLGLALLVFGAALYPLMAGQAKMRDRMSAEAPHSLDGMAYMQTATYWDYDHEMDLSQDYRAIRWMQENVQGSPVIVEANAPEYHWGTRFTIYTGLPGVVGWNWHQRQQRAVVSDLPVWGRVEAVGNFYNTVDPMQAQTFLKTYDVHYIVVGQLERAMYEPAGIQKFELLNGRLWKEVYRDGDTVIYQVGE